MDGDYGNNEDPLSLHKYLYTENEPVDHFDPSGHDLEDVLTAVSIGITINALANVGITAGLAYETFDPDDPGLAFLVTVRGGWSGRGGLVEGGFDLVVSPQLGNICAYGAVQGGGAPVTPGRNKGEGNAMVTLGMIFNLDDPSDWEGASSTTTLPIAALLSLRMLPPNVGNSGLFGFLTKLQYLNNRGQFDGVVQIGFGTSDVVFGTVGLWWSNSFAWEAGWDFPRVDIGQLVGPEKWSPIQRILQKLTPQAFNSDPSVLMTTLNELQFEFGGGFNAIED
jgi:hypothetical protein